MYIGKWGALNRGLKLIKQLIKVFGCLFERHIRQRVEIDEMQSRLMSGHGGTTVAVFILSQLQKLLLASSQRRNFIESTNYDETKKIAHDSQIVRAE